MVIFYVGARSGGHIMPLLAHASLHTDKEDNIFFTTDTATDKIAMHNATMIVKKHIMLDLPNIPKNIFSIPRYFYFLLKNTMNIVKYFISYKPDYIITTGGYLGALVSLIGLCSNTPVHLYILDAYPGKGARFIARYASIIYLCGAASCKNIVTKKSTSVMKASFPLRFREDDKLSKEQACKLLAISPHTRIILILGGSQGSQFLFDTIKIAFGKLNQSLKASLLCIHQVGLKEVSQVEEWYKNNNIQAHVFGYLSTLQLYYSAADYVISRAGAGALAELAFFKKKTIIVPLRNVAEDHQVANAKAYDQMYPDLFTTSLSQKIEEVAEVIFEGCFSS